MFRAGILIVDGAQRVAEASVEDVARQAECPVELEMSTMIVVGGIVVEVEVRSPNSTIDARAEDAGLDGIVDTALQRRVMVGLRDAAKHIVVVERDSAGEFARQPPAGLLFLLLGYSGRGSRQECHGDRKHSLCVDHLLSSRWYATTGHAAAGALSGELARCGPLLLLLRNNLTTPFHSLLGRFGGKPAYLHPIARETPQREGEL
jgi:hypothetical protein